MRLFAGDRIHGIMERFKIPDDQPMEASILSRQIESAQKKVEEQNFVARKNVLKYDDVMNTQRMVIYEQRKHVLDGDDLSDEIREWIEEVIGANVAQFTDAEIADEWDLDGLVDADERALRERHHGRRAARRGRRRQPRRAHRRSSSTTRSTSTPSARSRSARELMREIERYVILQIVDTRWREHLESMDYLREGVHLRAMAQKDPLVEYRGEGPRRCSRTLGRAIREEVVLTLFHVEVQRDEAERQLQPVQAPQPVAYEHESVARRRRDRRRRRRRGDGARRATADRDGRAEPGRQRAPRRRPQRPVLVRLRQEVQALPRR